MEQIERKKSNNTVEKVTNSESEAGEDGGREVKRKLPDVLRGYEGFYFKSDIDIKAMEGF